MKNSIVNTVCEGKEIRSNAVIVADSTWFLARTDRILTPDAMFPHVFQLLLWKKKHKLVGTRPSLYFGVFILSC